MTLDYCSTQSHITPCNATLENHFEWPKPESQSCSASAFPYFEADAELGVIQIQIQQWRLVVQGHTIFPSALPHNTLQRTDILQRILHKAIQYNAPTDTDTLRYIKEIEFLHGLS